MEKETVSSSEKVILNNGKERFEIPGQAMFKKFSKERDVSLVYGDAIEVEGKKVVPVAKVTYMG
ncbi:hypothetical protein, partial [Pseudomonas sp. 2995-1]|uniref:hypothetical protein n=1 Tax=Pseudomonas sp. 2995-1 TaxID=1712679 RepID=UPI001C462E91